MHKPESVLENEMSNILWDFKIQAYHLILVRRLDLVFVLIKKNLPSSGFCRYKRKLKDIEILGSCQRTKVNFGT